MIDHVLHGLVTIRLQEPPAHVVDSVVRTLGPSSGPAADTADVTVRFVDRLPAGTDLRWLNRREAAYDGDSFYVTDGAGARARLAVESVGDRVELVCERRIGAVPLLLPIVGLRLLERGHVLLHAAAFRDEGRTVLVAGWKKGGKTEILMPFLAAGATHLADEWTVVSADGSVRGLTGQLQLWDWHLRQLPGVWRRLPPRQRTRLRLARMAGAAAGAQGGFVGRLTAEAGVATLTQARVMPGAAFPGQLGAGAHPVDVVLLAGVGADERIEVAPIDAAEVARRMVASLAYERAPLRVADQQNRFAFPGRDNRRLADAERRELEILTAALQALPAYEVVHPYPVDLAELRRAVQPHLGSLG